MSWLTTMTWYQQAATAFFLGFLPPLVPVLWWIGVRQEQGKKAADVGFFHDWFVNRADKQITADINKEKAKVRSVNVCLHCGGSTCISTHCYVTGWDAYAVGNPLHNSGGSGGSGASGGTTAMTFQSGGIVARGGSGSSNSVAITCNWCAAPIPSGTYCSMHCLTQGDPTRTFYPTGCMDCGSGIHPSYSVGCPQAGRVTGYLPIPGPYGSPGLTAAQAAQAQKKPVPFSGMAGYSEAGTPDDWDLELGYIRGYRWFSIQIPESWAGIRRREVRTGYFDVNGKPEVHDEGPLDLPDEKIQPLIGAYGGNWLDGVNEAKCTKNGHEPPEVRWACGCGFWAYFDENLAVSSVLGGWNSVSDGTVGICVLGCVEGTGRVIVGEKGFRSQYAKIVGLTVGQAAIPDLMWWKSVEYAHDAYGNSYTVLPGSTGAGMSDFLRNGSGSPYQVQCSDDEIYNRLARIEDMLGRKYPSARIVSSEDTLRKLMPPDRSSS